VFCCMKLKKKIHRGHHQTGGGGEGKSRSHTPAMSQENKAQPIKHQKKKEVTRGGEEE